MCAMWSLSPLFPPSRVGDSSTGDENRLCMPETFLRGLVQVQTGRDVERISKHGQPLWQAVPTSQPSPAHTSCSASPPAGTLVGSLSWFRILPFLFSSKFSTQVLKFGFKFLRNCGAEDIRMHSWSGASEFCWFLSEHFCSRSEVQFPFFAVLVVGPVPAWDHEETTQFCPLS